MKNLLVGNGINIQFDNKNYTTTQIMLRILKNCDRDDFPSHIIVNFPYLLKNYFGELYLAARDMIEGKYDRYANCIAEIKALESFKNQYSGKIEILRITDIGMEDYYLIHDLMCHKLNMINPAQYYIRESMKVAYFFAIYNDGKLNELYKLYPEKFKSYLSNFDNIFTTNYDSNIESTINKEIFHIHGQFDKKDDVYNPDSFRNQLPDAPIKNIEIDDKYYYLYSNAISTHCGEYKNLTIKQNSLANDCVEKMANAYNSDENIRKEIDSWVDDDNSLTSNLGYSIQLKSKYPELSFSENYHFDKLKEIEGNLDIIGLSPWNDFHIFEAVDNANIMHCTYYFFDKSQCDVVRRLLPKLNSENKILFESSTEFWRKQYES